jgi:sec-independent protein translocase protein TatB
MFDFAWSEIAVIAGVALVLIGPKDMPVAIRTITDMIKKARRMAGEFQTHVDEMMRDANLQEVRDQINEIRNFDLKGVVERNIDPDSSLRNTFATNPLEPTSPPPVIPMPGEAPANEPVSAEEYGPPPPPQFGPPPPPVAAFEPPEPRAPAFIPPSLVPPDMEAPPECAAAAPDAPAFIPPELVLERRSQPPM